MNGCSLQRFLQFFRIFSLSTKAFLFSSCILIKLSKKLSLDFGVVLPVLTLNRTCLSVVQLNGNNVDGGIDLIYSKSYLSFSVRLCRNSLLPSVVCFRSANYSKEFNNCFFIEFVTTHLLTAEATSA